jgi:hypothetical protein
VITVNSQPDRVNTDKSCTNFAGIQAVNVILKIKGNGQLITIRQRNPSKISLNKITAAKSISPVRCLASMPFIVRQQPTLALRICKGQFGAIRLSAFQQFAALAA